MLVIDGKLLVVHSYQADIYDPSTCDNLMSYKTGQNLITKACVYAKNKFCIACNGKLLAYCANSSRPVAEMKIDDHITDMQFADEENLVYILEGKGKLVKLNIKSLEKTEFDINQPLSLLVDKEKIFVGNAEGILLVTDFNLKKLHKV